MDCDEIRYLLVGLKEGTISPEEQELVVRHTATCARCAQDLKAIDEAFGSLRDVTDEEVPSHYFTNLLPRIRQRLDEQPGGLVGFSGFALPVWVQRCLAPVSAGAVLSCMIAMYILFNPAADYGQLPLREIVAGLPKEEIEGVTESMSFSDVLARTMEPSQRFMETTPNPALISTQIERELVEDQLNHGHSLSIFLAADHPFEDISDDDVDSVIKKLSDASL